MGDFAVRNEPKLPAGAGGPVDEDAPPLELGKDTGLHFTDDIETAVRGRGPAAWWRAGLVALVIVAAMLLLFQVLMGGPVTDMTPGTPTTAPAQAQ